VRSILCRKYAVAFDGTDQPRYKTSFMEGGVCKTEWLEAGELPVKKLADFEVALDEDEEEEEAEIRAAKRPRTTRSRGPAPPPADLPLSDDMDKEEDDDNDDSEEDSEDDDDRDFIADGDED
jgi:hypothetical protein